MGQPIRAEIGGGEGKVVEHGEHVLFVEQLEAVDVLGVEEHLLVGVRVVAEVEVQGAPVRVHLLEEVQVGVHQDAEEPLERLPLVERELQRRVARRAQDQLRGHHVQRVPLRCNRRGALADQQLRAGQALLAVRNVLAGGAQRALSAKPPKKLLAIITPNWVFKCM